MPLDITIFVVQRSAPDLEYAKRHARPDLTEFDTIVAGTNIDVMAKLDAVVDIFEGHDSTASPVLVGGSEGVPRGK